MLKVMREYLDQNYRSNYLHIQFFDEIIQAIRYVGDNKIKIANMSLGTSFQAPVDPPTNLSRRKQIQRDGRSRSALPCDLSSSFMREFEPDPATPTLANNRLKGNILCVGSLNSKDELSSFMNLTLTDTPFVLSYGESILAPVKTTSCEHVNSEMTNENKFGSRLILPSLDANSDQYDAFLAEQGFLKASATPKERESARRDAMWEFTLTERKFVNSINQAEFYRRCFKTTAPRHRLTGTSMAAPAVAGYIARKLAAYMRKMGLEETQAYAHPEFSPENIVRMLR